MPNCVRHPRKKLVSSWDEFRLNRITALLALMVVLGIYPLGCHSTEGTDFVISYVDRDSLVQYDSIVVFLNTDALAKSDTLFKGKLMNSNDLQSLPTSRDLVGKFIVSVKAFNGRELVFMRESIVDAEKHQVESSMVLHPLARTTPFPIGKTLNVGAQGNQTLGSALELDTGLVYFYNTAIANLADVDLVFMYYGGAYHIDNTKSAKAAGIANSINLTNSYPDASVKDNKFVKVTAAPANQEAAKKAFQDGTSKLSSSTVSNGDMFIVETTDGDYAYVKVVAVTGNSNTGAADFSVTVTSIP